MLQPAKSVLQLRYAVGMVILLYALAVALYLAAIVIARRGLAWPRASVAVRSAESANDALGQSSKAGLWVLGAATLAHSVGLVLSIGFADPPRFGFAPALSIMFCGGAVLLWLESTQHRIEPLWLFVLPFSALAAALPVVFPGSSIQIQTGRPLFIPHLVVGMLAYSFLAFAALHAALMMLAERSLHRPGQQPGLSAGSAMIQHAGGPLAWLERLPPLLVLERILFRILLAGFVLLTLTLISGVLFSEAVFGQPWRLDHKTVFSVIAWTVFAVLLVGRSLWGWRGRLAARITLGGFILLMLAYVGSRFVLEVVLGRAAA